MFTEEFQVKAEYDMRVRCGIGVRRKRNILDVDRTIGFELKIKLFVVTRLESELQESDFHRTAVCDGNCAVVSLGADNFQLEQRSFKRSHLGRVEGRRVRLNEKVVNASDRGRRVRKLDHEIGRNFFGGRFFDFGGHFES
jgi:hypothetical protein